MAKSRREQQLDKTRRVEWIYYAVFIPLMVVAVQRNTPAIALWSLLLVMLVLGAVVQLWQYRTMDELARLRLLKSWAVASGVTNLSLAAVLFWTMVRWSTGPVGQRLSGMSVPFTAVYAVLVIAALTAALTNFYLRRRESQE